MKAKKSLGQNFLMHARIANRIVSVSGVAPTDTVLEIGPGTGMLTRELLASAKKVIAVETDSELFDQLKKTFAEEIAAGRLKLVHDDIRKFALSRLGAYNVIANIPYYLTGEIIRSFLEAKNQPHSMTLLVQKEVAERIARSKTESILSLSVKAFGTPKYEFTVPRGAFKPAPKVDSAVLTIKEISRKQFTNSKHERNFFKYVRAGFAHKRKFLKNNLAEIGVHAKDLPEKIRAENVRLQTWLTLAKIKVEQSQRQA